VPIHCTPPDGKYYDPIIKIVNQQTGEVFYDGLIPHHHDITNLPLGTYTVSGSYGLPGSEFPTRTVTISAQNPSFRVDFTSMANPDVCAPPPPPPPPGVASEWTYFDCEYRVTTTFKILEVTGDSVRLHVKSSPNANVYDADEERVYRLQDIISADRVNDPTKHMMYWEVRDYGLQQTTTYEVLSVNGTTAQVKVTAPNGTVSTQTMPLSQVPMDTDACAYWNGQLQNNGGG
jgi:hypothetical protein